MSVHGKLLVILMLCCPNLLVAGEEPDPKTAKAEVTSAERLRELVKELDADRYSKRQAATKELSAAGPAAMPLLVETAKSASTEASSRCIQILEKHLQGDDEAARATAEKSLRELAESAKVSTARLARKALGEDVDNDELEEDQPDPIAPLPLNPIGAGQFQIQLQMNGRGGTRVTRRVVNGVKDTNVEDNGRKIKIHEEPNGKIKMTITEVGDDEKPKTKTYEADSADELKKKHAEAHQLYKRYANEGPRIRFGPQGLGLNPLIPGQIIPPGGIAPPRDGDIDLLKRTVELLKELNLTDLSEDERKTLREEIERIQKELVPKPSE